MKVFRSEQVMHAAIVMLCLFDSSPSAFGVTILNDPNGFEDISWGTILSETEHFVEIEDSGRLQTYEQRGRPSLLGPTMVDSIQFTTFERKFGRVTVRYSGQETHEEIMTYLQSKYGRLIEHQGKLPSAR